MSKQNQLEQYVQDIGTSTMFSIVGFEELMQTRLGETELVLHMPKGRELVITIRNEKN